MLHFDNATALKSFLVNDMFANSNSVERVKELQALQPTCNVYFSNGRKATVSFNANRASFSFSMFEKTRKVCTVSDVTATLLKRELLMALQETLKATKRKPKKKVVFNPYNYVDVRAMAYID